VAAVKKSAGALVGVAVAGPLLLAVPVLAVTAGSASACSADAGSVDASAVARQVKAILDGKGAGPVAVAGLSDAADQVPNAEVIVATGIAMGVPARGQVVALATALQESRLLNLTYGDRDSLGLFQQRPSQGWGTAAQILDPVHASTRFYAALVKVAGWQSMTVAEAAQAVQRSAFPDAYATWEPLATTLQTAIVPLLTQDTASTPTGGAADTTAVSAGDGCTAGDDGSGSGPIPDGSLPAGYVIPAGAPEKVRTAIRWALGQLGTPYQWGGRCDDPHGPDPMGRCDCSALMQAAWRAAGVTLPRTTYGQVRAGKAVSVGSLEPGDLVFTEGSATAPQHVGMYIGGGLIVNAPHTGAVVRVETLASWRPLILAARRIA
jgi:cell wall-associated NlpC family hydrolase